MGQERDNANLVGMLLRWANKLGGAVLASMILSSISLIGQTLLLRYLPIDDAGVFALFMTIITSLALIGNLGQPTQMLRVYSREPAGTYNWPSDFRTTAILTAPFIIIGSASAGYLTDLSLAVTLAIFLTSLPLVQLATTTQILGAHQQYWLSNATLRLPNALLLITALVVATVPSDIALSITLVSLAAFSYLVLLLSLIYLRRRIPVGDQTLSSRERLAGLYLLAMQISQVLPLDGLTALAGGFLAKQDIAAFFAIAVMFRLVRLLYAVFLQVFVSEIARMERVQYGAIVVGLGGFSIALLLGMLLLGPKLIHLIYGGRYDYALELVPWVAIAGALNIVEVLPKGFIVGRLPERRIRRFSVLEAVTTITFVLGGVMLARTHGIGGLGAALAMVFLLRFVITYGYVFRDMRRAGQ
jgi:O-antigen/teichoic acid export membrane protein